MSPVRKILPLAPVERSDRNEGIVVPYVPAGLLELNTFALAESEPAPAPRRSAVEGVRLSTLAGQSPADATEWVGKVRQGVTFHDGEPFGADAVVANLEAAMAREPVSHRRLLVPSSSPITTLASTTSRTLNPSSAGSM